jgi:drug/metabolite transporter superfamily protein YnfA
MKRFQLLYEFWLFLRQNKKLWLVPMILTLVLIGGLLIFAQSSALAPFIYSIF